MNVRHLGWPHERYLACLSESRLAPDLAEALRDALDRQNARKVLLFGANTGTGAAIRQAVGDAFAAFVNSDTLDPGLRLDFDAVVLATSARHYPEVLGRLGPLVKDENLPVLTLFDTQPDGQPDPVASSGKRRRPCHYEDMFVTHAGDVFPCCLTWNDPGKRIGSIQDDDLPAKLAAYDITPCECAPWAFNSIFRPARTGDTCKIRMLNLELSLFCNSRCAMCCVHAPEYTSAFGRPDHSLHPQILRFVGQVRPEHIYLQGGEVLVQPGALDLVEAIRRKWPEIRLSLVTNGNVPLSMADRAETMFHSLAVSMYGFTSSAYRVVTGLDVENVKRFCERVAARSREKLCVKYLTTPVNFHEAPDFLEWALDVKPQAVMIVDADSQDYVRYRRPLQGAGFDPGRNPLHDLYWERIFTRTIRRLEKVVRSRRAFLEESGIHLDVCGGVFDRLGVDLGA